MFIWPIPSIGGEANSVQVEPGQPLFVVGPNGSGKSALLYRLALEHSPDRVLRVLAHRQMWMDNSAIDLTPNSRRLEDAQIRNWDHGLQARWSDQHGRTRVNVALFDLIAEQHRRATAIADRVDDGNLDDAEKLSKQQSAPLKRLNRLLALGKMQVQIASSEDEVLFAVRNDTLETYGIAEMSDGERAAMLLAAQVLVAKPDQILLIDEPERHLHRAISISLLAALVKERPDCTWVISTHELSLPAAFPASRSLLLRGVKWENDQPIGWSIGILEPGDALPEDLRRDILGARETIVFVEGSPGGIDQQLYEALINNNKVAVIPKGGWRDVQQAVSGLQTTTDLHHVRAFGIIDGDGRPDTGPSQMGSDNVFVLPCWSIESLLYSEEVRTSVAHAHAGTTGRDPSVIVSDMESRLLGVFSQQNTRQHLVSARIHHAVVHDIQKQTPSVSDLESEARQIFPISVPIPRSNEEQIYDQLVGAKDLQKLIVNYPIKETPALGALCNALGWQDRHQYQEAAIEQIRTQPSLRGQLRKRLEGLITALTRKN